ncbi:hypothetical protein HDG32_007270 [Paraburkholderia sp. CI2]|uniref:hypothetical protein n=1 Tax=Paraburkholderia sp. CI2 TaxID=2723093 RepID=UPI001607121D|nr:hypothetical protein [Paraburkholderia sp. CI2]MBB5471114.1 hypothetical protein [Paraburkholderia sp. CI2]
MKSSMDELIEPVGKNIEPRTNQRPPGGKALLRLQQLLQERGLGEVAEATVQRALTEELRRDFHDRAQAYSAAPLEQKLYVSGADVHTLTAQVAEHYKSVALEESGPLPSIPTATGPQWRNLGPWTIPNGQTYGSSRVNVSGRVAAIAVDPSNPAHVLCGAANGGVWESFDRGGSWAPRTDYAATLAVGAVVFDPRNPSIAYCGTGEGNWWSWLGAGILKSTNGGASWSTLCTAPFTGQGFYDLVVDATNTQSMLAATTGGLFESNDAGVHWTQRRAVVTWSVSMSATEVLAACSDGIFRSTDGGVNWTAVSLPGTPGSFNRLAVSIAKTDNTVAYAWGANGGSAYLWRRTSAGWAAQPVPPGVSTGQAWYDWYCACSPDNASQVYLGAIESYRGDLSGNAWTWRTISNKGTTGDSIHPDQHAIAFETGHPDTIYVGCDGGLFRSPDRGVTWASCNNGLVISEFEYLAQSLGSSRWIIGGTQDNGTERWTGSPMWTHVADGDGGDCAVNRTTPSTVFHTYYNMSPERSTTSGDFGSWTYLPPPVPAGEGSLFYPPMDASANGGDTVAIGGDALYVSRNNMTSWTRLPFPSAARSSAMYVPNANTVYTGSTDGRIFRTTWNGSAWTAVTALTTPRANASMSDIVVDASNSNRIWATYTTTGGGRVYRSDNGGSAWADVTHNLPNLPITAVDVDTSNSNRAWVSADLGVYQTLDGGTTWTDFSASLPNSFVGDIVFHPYARVLRAGTRNRGVWEIPVDGWMTTPVCGVQWSGSLNPNETKRWFSWGWPATWHMVWTVMPSTVNQGAAELTWTVQVQRSDPEHVTYWINVQNLTNVAVSFEGRYCILSRY